MTKQKAFATHLGISFVIFLIILFFIIFEWYPPPFFYSDGGWQGIRIIAGVDLVLGPLLTLIVFKPGKRWLKLDLTVIAIIQASALSWGIWTVHRERPLATVFVEDHFISMNSYDLLTRGMNIRNLKVFGAKAPYWIYSDLPQDTDKMSKIRLQAVRQRIPVFQLTQYYKPLEKNTKAIEAIGTRSLDMQKWLMKKPADMRRFQQFLDKQGQKKLIFVPWHARYKDEIVALDADTGRYAGILDIAPPAINEKAPWSSQRKSNKPPVS